MVTSNLATRYQVAMEKFTKWRRVFAAWQTGNMTDNGPESKAIRDHRELSMLLRAEVNALTALLQLKGTFTDAEFAQQIIEETERLSKTFEEHFPGFKSSDYGMEITMPEAGETIKKWER